MSVVNHRIQERVKDFNWSLSEYDRLIDVIFSNLITIKEELHEKYPEKENIVSNYYDVLNFKIETLYSLLIKLEELIFNSTFAYYRKYHGSIRGELSNVEFESIKREASYIFDSFLAQYKSLLDLVVKFVFEFAFADHPQLSKQTLLDSFEKMLNLMVKGDKTRFKKIYRLSNQSNRFSYLQNLFDNFIKNRNALVEIKDYRDYIIHHGYVRHQLTAKSVEGQVIFSYQIPRLIRTGKTYQIDPSTNLTLEYFCREKLYLLLSLIAELTDLIYDVSFKQTYIDKLTNFSSELVKDVILRVSRKDYWADKVIFSEEELKAVLESQGINFNELVEDFTFTEREQKDTEKDELIILPTFEKTYYKPIGKIRVFKNKFIFEKSTTSEELNVRERLEQPTYGVTFIGLSLNDFVSQSKELEDILNTLRKSGLVYVIKTKEGIRYASVRGGLKSLVISLEALSHFKWSIIQVPEMNYFRPRTPEETKNTYRILGNEAKKYLEKEDKDRERILQEYEEWKKQPEHYFTNPVRIVNEDDETIAVVTHKEFLEEKKYITKIGRKISALFTLQKTGKR